jgi:pre-mRNA-processing factor SLU7
LNSTLPSLKHQRQYKHEEFDKKWYNRGQKAGPAAIKYRKGACTNCGAMTHNVKVGARILYE